MGATGYVRNGDTINIELISSDEYDTIVREGSNPFDLIDIVLCGLELE